MPSALHPLRAALLASTLVLGGAVAGCGASGDSGDSGDQDIEVGESFTHDGFKVADGWQLDKVTRSVAMEDVELAEVHGKITNVGEEARAPIFELVFAKEGERVTTVRCSAAELEPQETDDLLCPGLSSTYPEDFDTIVAQPITR